MQQLILIFHLIASACLLGLVLLQHGKGADMGASFGSGASQTMFGSVGPAPFLLKLTASLVGIFFLTCLSLNYWVSYQEKKSDELSSLRAAASTAPVSAPTAPAPSEGAQHP